MRTINKIFIVLTLIIAGSRARGDDASVPTKEVMDKIYGSIQTLLPLSLSDKKFADEANREVIAKNLKSLADNANQLPGHTEFKDATFLYLGRALAKDAKDTYRRFEKGRTNEALFLFTALTDNCVACHSRLPAQDSKKAANLFNNLDETSLAPDERARLYLVTRQFEKSMAAYRDVVLSPNYSGDEICLSDWIGEYLVTAIRVKRDLPAAKETLQKFGERKDLPLYMRHNVEAWTAAITELQKRNDLTANLKVIRQIIDEGKALNQFPMDQQGQIHFLVASSLLHEFVVKKPTGKEAAEAYFLLGLTESLNGRAFRASQNEFYLETAIRNAPNSVFAERAYRQLEEQILFEYSGSAGTYVPEEADTLLRELRELIYTAKAQGSKK